jgi:hypothetical protein
MVITILTVYTYLPCRVFAESPSFVRQEIKDILDDDDDFITYNESSSEYNKADTNCTQQSIKPTDIKSVSYNSDGKTLDATIWLNSSFIESPDQDQSEIHWKHLVYSMYVDIDSAYDLGVDYIINILWSEDNKTWTKEVIESSPPAAKFVSTKSNLTGFFDKSYVMLSLDLNMVNYPTQYKVFFVTGANFTKEHEPNAECSIVDVSNLVSVPPPEFEIFTSPTLLELRPGEQKNVQLKIQSKTNLNSNIALFTEGNENVQADFTTNQTFMSPSSIAISTLKITATQDAKPQSFSIPLSMHVTFPKIFEVTLGGKLNFENAISPMLQKKSYFTITILPELTWPEHMENFAKWLSPINSVWTFITAVGAVMVPIIIRMYKKKEEKGNKSNNKIDEYSS